jgi:hypothetical protein
LKTIRRILLAASAVTGVAIHADAQMLSRPQYGPEHAPPTEMTARLDAAAASLLKAGDTADRLVEYDIAWPATTGEYRKVGKSGVLLISVATADPSEIPIARVYIRAGTLNTPLRRIAELRTTIADAGLRAAVGGYREDAFYLVPARAALESGTLLIDFAANRTGFVVAQLPMKEPDVITADRDRRPSDPDLKAVGDMIDREFPGWISASGAR